MAYEQPPSLDDGEDKFFAWLHRMRATEPVAFDEATGMWNVFRYSDMVDVMADTELFSSDLSRPLADASLPDPLGKANFVIMDPPRHTELRRVVQKWFVPAFIGQLAGDIRAAAADLLDQVAGADTFEVNSALAYPLPILVISQLLGVPREDRRQFQRWSEAILNIAYDDLGDEAPEAFIARQTKELTDYLHRHVRDRRANSRDDLISHLIDCEIEGKALDDDEIVSIAALVLLAGHTTTAMLIGNGIRCFDTHREAFLQAHREGSLSGVVEEVLRYYPPFTVTTRVCTRPTTLGSASLRENQYVNLWTIAGNRDPDVFTEPDVFDPSRSPNRHLSFGRGVHSCLGAFLARLETTVTLEELLSRYPGLSLRTPKLEFHRSRGIFGTKEIVVAP